MKYITIERDEIGCKITYHNTFGDAVDYADAHGLNYISEDLAAGKEWVKCNACGNFVDVLEFDAVDVCSQCKVRALDHYFEVVEDFEGDFPVLTPFEEFEDAEEYAKEHNAARIEEYGGYEENFYPCWFCGGYFPASELDDDNTCDRCQEALWSRGEYNFRKKRV